MGRASTGLKNLVALFVGSCVALLLLEFLLRMHNPMPFRLKGTRFVLKPNQRWVFQNPGIRGLDQVVVHTKNALGFRGPNLPDDPEDYFKVITVGGSTTECCYIPDGKTWIDVMASELERQCPEAHFWINNAGMDGQSTFGHIILVRDYIAKLHPDCLIFLVGANDVGRTDIKIKDKAKGLKKVKRAILWLADRSEVVSLLLNTYRALKGNLRMGHREVDLTALPSFAESLRPEVMQRERSEHRGPLEGYRERLELLVKLSEEIGAEPVFVTQPALFGPSVDPVTGVDIGKVRAKGSGLSGAERWEVWSWYNSVVLEVCKEHNLTCIDLGALMPKRSDYFYDWVHFTNEGAAFVGKVLGSRLAPVLCELATSGKASAGSSLH